MKEVEKSLLIFNHHIVRLMQLEQELFIENLQIIQTKQF